MEKHPENSRRPGDEPGSVNLPQAGRRAPGPQGSLLIPCPILPSAEGAPQPADWGVPGAGAQRGSVAWAEWVGSMLMMLLLLLLLLLMMMMMAGVVVMVEDEGEEEEEREEKRSQPPVCYEKWPLWPLAEACCSSCWSGALRSTGNESHPPTHVQLQLCEQLATSTQRERVGRGHTEAASATLSNAVERGRKKNSEVSLSTSRGERVRASLLSLSLFFSQSSALLLLPPTCVHRGWQHVCVLRKRACAMQASKMHIRRGLEDPRQRGGRLFWSAAILQLS